MILSPSELPIGQYHRSCPQWLSKTTLNAYRKDGAALWHAKYISKEIPLETPDGAAQGLALDCVLTEDAADFNSKFAFKPEGMSFATKEGKAWRAGQEVKTILSADDALILEDAAAAVRAHPKWPEIQKCQSQMTIRRHSESLGLGLQSRPDWINLETRTLWDLKKTRDLSIFGRQAIDVGYHIQAAVAGWCLAGAGIALEHAYLVAVEWERKSRCRVYEIPHEALAYADAQMRETAAEIADRIKRKDWLDHPPEIEPLPIPSYIMRKMEGA
jgi:hypothetical protein